MKGKIEQFILIQNIKTHTMKKFISILSIMVFAMAANAQKDSVKKFKPIYRPIRPMYIKLDSTIQFIPSTVGPYCPTKLLGGDREFGGHGPEIWAWIKLSIEGGNQLFATVYLHARETQSDWSETEGTWKKLLYTAPSGFTISQILSGKNSEVHYVSKPGMSAFSPAALRELLGGASGTDVPFTDDGLVTRWNIVGDTMGDDISTDRNCNDDTQVAIQLNPVKLQLHRK